jgi:hypothetical protein
VSGLIEKDVLRFQVAVDDILLVKIFQSENDFCDVYFGSLLVEFIGPSQMEEKLACE